MKNSLKNIRGIVFDLDDTLYPQISYKMSGFKIVSAWVATHFKLKQSTVLSELEKILTQYGPSYPFMFDRLVERLKINPRSVTELVRLFIQHEPRIRCFDGVFPMLSRLRRKYCLGILTDGRFTVQKKKVMGLSLENQVDQILYSDALGLEKPDPELFQWFEDAFHLNGENLIYVGDNPQKDFYGANRRGWITVMVKTGHSAISTIKAGHEPQVEIATIVDLDEIFQFEVDGDHC